MRIEKMPRPATPQRGEQLPEPDAAPLPVLDEDRTTDRLAIRKKRRAYGQPLAVRWIAGSLTP